jgi:ribosomal protein S4
VHQIPQLPITRLPTRPSAIDELELELTLNPPISPLQKIRQSWNKYNLYNLSRTTTPPYKTRTFFQQKWTAKSMLRAYHSEQVREGMWERMFSRRLRSVVPMNPEYLARNDGSLESAGRGSGLEAPRGRPRPQAIPYMQMTFAPLERRLDTAIFRSLFASSARQARQFVVHGAVTVNGKKVRGLQPHLLTLC